MKKTTILSLLLVLFGTFLIPGVNASGQESAKQVQGANSIPLFWEKFKAAVIKGDKQTVAALSRFPISRGYGLASLKNKAQLMRHYREIFFTETDAAKCFPKAKPFVEKERPKEFTIGCSFRSDDGGGGGEPFQYTFILTRKGWRFTGFENINE
jgi:hypothetical protein